MGAGCRFGDKVAGVDKPAMNDKQLASAVFGIWLGERRVQDNIKKDLVSRAGSLAK